MKKLTILIFLILTFRIVSFGNTSDDTTYKSRYVRCIITNEILEDELIKRDNLLKDGEEFNKILADSLMGQRITNAKLQKDLSKEIHHKKQWRKFALWESFIIASSVIIGSIIR